MINEKSTELDPLLESKLINVKISKNEFVLEFDNGRTFTGQLRLNSSDIELVPCLNIICGYHTQPFKHSKKGEKCFGK